jgi:hypothetical protein
MSYIENGLGKHGQCIVTSIDPEVRPWRVGLGYFKTPLPYTSHLDPCAVIVSHELDPTLFASFAIVL